jgi:hypothetical protein
LQLADNLLCYPALFLELLAFPAALLLIGCRITLLYPAAEDANIFYFPVFSPTFSHPLHERVFLREIDFEFVLWRGGLFFLVFFWPLRKRA